MLASSRDSSGKQRPHLTESAWLTSESPFEMLKHLDGKIADEAFMRFSVACCRRIWPLITDARSRAVVEATEAYLAGAISTKQAGLICADWVRAYEGEEVEDRAGGSTNEAIESVYGVGYGHAAQVSAACFESAGYAASEPLGAVGAPQSEITATWLAAESVERLAQCELLRKLFGYLPDQKSDDAEPPRASTGARSRPMTEAEWQKCDDPKPMLQHLKDRASSRKLRLFAVACCRDVWKWMPDVRSREGVEVAGKFADGLIGEGELEVVRAGTAGAWTRVWGMASHIYQSARAAHFALDLKQEVLFLVPQETANANRNYVTLSSAGDPDAVRESLAEVRRRQVGWLRDLFGNPFRPVAFDPCWRTPHVLRLARGIYEEDAFDQLPMLADALLDVGCDDVAILAHCRASGAHVRGCWPVDLILANK
jgi:hypothetical protein